MVLKSFIFDAFIICLQMSSLGLAGEKPFKHLLKTQRDEAPIRVSQSEILKKSQISYRAEGGFTGVRSYGVILSCVNGKISMMKSIHDPRHGAKGQFRQIGTISTAEYVQLWNKIKDQAVFKMKDAPMPRMDIEDEFTIHFHASAGNKTHQFQVYGISRPEAARYYAIQKLIDDTARMQSLWNTHSSVARNR